MYAKADVLSGEVIGAAIEVHRDKGPGLLESIYERCFRHEMSLRRLHAVNQKVIQIAYKGLVFDASLRFDVLVEDCLIIEVKAVEKLLPIHRAQLLSYMKLLDLPIGLLLNFHEPVLKDGISRLILSRADQPSPFAPLAIFCSNSDHLTPPDGAATRSARCTAD